MACNITQGYSLDCRNNTGGIQKIYVANFDDDQSYTLDGDGQITGITSGVTYYTFEQRPQTAGFEETVQSSVENATLFYEQSVTMAFDKNTAALRNQLYLMAQSQLSIIVLDQNGSYWLVGEQNGADITEGTLPRGTAYGDRNGSLLTAIAMEPSPARQMSSAAFATLTISS